MKRLITYLSILFVVTAFFFNLQTFEAKAEGYQPKEIDVLVAVDTDYFKKTYPHPSQDSNNPTSMISAPEGHVFMVATDPRGLSAQGTGRLSLKANVKDTVSFQGTSPSFNSDDAVLVYDITPYGSYSNVFDKFSTEPFTLKKAVIPGDPPQDVTNGPESFSPLVARVKKAGKELYWVNFAIYSLEEDGETQTLYGYFRFEPEITVKISLFTTAGIAQCAHSD